MKAEATPEAAGKSRALLKLRRAELVDRVHRRPRALAALCALNGEVFGWVLRSVTSCLFLGLAAASGTTQDWNGTTFTADGSVHGGDGIWNNVSTNFTDAATGTLSQSWQNGTAVFEANPGIITLGDNIVFQGLDFTSDEYEIRGTLGAGGFALEPDGVATVSADPGVSAIISAPISGAGGLDKQGPGTVVLSGTNSYSGTTTISATTISAGTLSVSTDANLGAAGAGITLNGGELLATGDGLVTTRPVFLAANGGTLAAASGGQAFFEGNITGAGPLLIGEPNGGGTVGLSGANTNTGTTTVVSGATLRAISLGALSSGSDFIVNGTLDLNGFSNQVGSLAGAGTVTNGAASTLAVLTAAGNSTFGGVLQDGPGVGARLALTKTGTGALILTGANTYSGGTTITAGTLEIGTNTVVNPLVGSIIGAVDNSSILNFINADSSGLTSVTTESGGSTHLLGSNTVGPAAVLTNAGGVFDISQTSAGVAIHSIAGAGIYDLGSKVLTVDDATSTQVSGMIQDGGTGGGTAGSLVKQGSGTLTLTGTNTYSGGTTINAGTLQIGNGGAGGSIIGPVTDNAALVVNRTGILSLAGPIIGIGTLTKAGPGTLNLTGTNTYGGGTEITGGILSVDSDTELGLIQAGAGGITLSGGELLTTGLEFRSARDIQLNEGTDTLAAGNGTFATYTGVISGGELVVGEPGGAHAGVVVLANPADSYHGTLVQGGATLSVASDLTLGNPGNGIILQGGELLSTSSGFHSGRSILLNGGRGLLAAATGTAGLFSGIISGDGLLVVGDGSNKGTVILSGVNDYSGGTFVTGGAILSVGSDASLGDPAGPVVVNGGEILITGNGFNSTRPIALVSGNPNVLAAMGGTSSTYSGVISGGGGLTVGDGVQTGTIILAAKNTFSGGTLIQSGQLLVANPAAFGTGNVILNGGTLGAEVRPIHVLGDFLENARGTLQLGVDGPNAGQYDSLNVRGNASLGGTLQLLSAGFQPAAGDQLVLVTTGGVVSGKFSSFQDPFVLGSGFHTIDLVYGLNSVVLKFLNTAHPGNITTIDFQSFARNGTANQRAAARLLDQVELNSGSASVTEYLLKQPTGDFLADFNKISPDVLSSLYEIGFSNSNMQRLNMEDRLDADRNGANGFSSNMKLGGAKIYLEADGSVDDGKDDKNPVQAVMQPSPENRWGVWVSGFGDFVNVDGDGNGKGYDFTTGGVTVGIDFRLTDNLVVGLMGDYSHTWSNLRPGHLDVDSGRGGVYASWFARGFYLDGAAYGGHNTFDTGRPGLAGLASGGTSGSEWSAFLSGGYDFHVGNLTVGPIAALQYTEVNIDGFSEHGSAAPMAIHEAWQDSLRSDIGFRVFYQWQVSKVIIEPSLKATWEHEYEYSALPIRAGFAEAPGPSATFLGPSEGQDSAVIDAGLSVKWTPTFSTYINYDGQLGRSNYNSNAVTGGFRIAF